MSAAQIAAAVAYRSPSPPPFASFRATAPPATYGSSSHMPSTGNPSNPQGPPTHPPNMSNIKYVKAKKRTRTVEQDEPQRNDAPPNRLLGRPAKAAKLSATSASADESTSSFLRSKPAAFPSLLTDTPSSLSKIVPDFSGHGMKELMEWTERGDEENATAIKLYFDGLYEASAEAWYAELRRLWDPEESDVKIPFTSLWPSLSNTIIDQIRDDFPKGTYLDSYYPVARLLGLTRKELNSIILRNNGDWGDFEEDFHAYFDFLKRNNPDGIVDPEQPPPKEVVKAIRFLKQHSLPGSLLGCWQYPLPPFKDIAPGLNDTTWIMESIEGDHNPHRSIPEFPNVLSPEQSHSLLLRIEARALRKAAADEAKAPPKPQCRRCKKEDHAESDLDEYGIKICPMHREGHAKHLREKHDLEKQVHIEIMAFQHRDLASKSMASTSASASTLSRHPNSTNYSFPAAESRTDKQNSGNLQSLFLPSNPQIKSREEYVLDLEQTNSSNPGLKKHAQRRIDLKSRLASSTPADAAQGVGSDGRSDQSLGPNRVRYANGSSRFATQATHSPHTPAPISTSTPPQPQPQAIPTTLPSSAPNTILASFSNSQPSSSRPQAPSHPYPHAPTKKRGPYKKKPSPATPKPTPPRIVSKDGMVSLSASNEAGASTARTSSHDDDAGDGAGGRSSTGTGVEDGTTSVSGV
ncbi:hypothetical protein BDW02DRAFT_601950 [Decorospora gaudefroyi]|uniref:Uncharacterized protein n=1 Tax=Decorospora gaudefroyi TaxID=184978 RepID=A0A6A5K212_9PLEO|nr:hypothetical protein BDW02DRAFT_601950 [Decorospora gaudefroyi]